MVRVLTLVTLLALFAGGSLGFFVANARDKAEDGLPAPVDPVLERKVEQYQQTYSLSMDGTAEIRATLKEYDQALADLLRRLRQTNSKDFKALADKANARIQSVISTGK